MTIAKMTTRGRFTLPADTCNKAQVSIGSKLDVTVNEAGEIVLRPLPDGMTQPRGKV